MFVKNKKEKKKKKTFTEIKVGTPHFDITPNIKKMITEKENLIKIKYKEKQNMLGNIRDIFKKLNEAETVLNEIPEQSDEMKMFYLRLNLTKKNHINSTNTKNKYKSEYLDLLNKNNYDPIEKLNQVGKKINFSKIENFEIEKEIIKVKRMNISSRFHIRNLPKKDGNLNISEINYLMNELNSLNNQKHESLIKLKNTKKIMKSSIIRFENVLKIYNENIMKNEDKDKKFIKIEKDINILKKDLLIKDEKKLYDNIYNDKSLIFNNNSNDNIKKNNHVNIIKLRILRNNNASNNGIFSARKERNLEKKKSMELIKINSNYFNDSMDNNINIEKDDIIKKRLFKKNKLPKIRNIKETNNKSVTIEKDENENIQLNKNRNNEKLNKSKINEINLQEINYKKEHYKEIVKKLENSINDIENMYKRKIKGIENILNTNREKYLDLKKRNQLLRIEIENLHKIIRIQVKEFVEITEKKNATFEPELSNIINIDN